MRWSKGARRVRSSLGYPRFAFDRRGWERFYKVWEMGHLIEVYKNSVYANRRLRPSLRRLVNERLPINQRVTSMVSPTGRHHIGGFGLNAISKILAVHRPNKWPVHNNPVAESLRHFGYRPARGASAGQRYEAFARFMSRFLRESAAPDMIALDAFFYRFWRRRLSQQ
jgi:hypothetical protein